MIRSFCIVSSFHPEIIPFEITQHKDLSSVRGSVTNNNGLWIGCLWFIDTIYYNTLNCSQLQQLKSMTGKDSLHCDWTTSVYWLCDWVGSDLRIGHFFSFRCPPVSTPQPNTQLNSTQPHYWTDFTILLRLNESESEPYVATDGQSASLSWNEAPIWGLRPELYYC
jgi:hypothetical protein